LDPAHNDDEHVAMILIANGVRDPAGDALETLPNAPWSNRDS
jgi:hypothetical protein